MLKNPPELIALDWGTSSFRAYLLGPSGIILSRVSSPSGVLKLKGKQAFEKTFERACGKWLRRLPSLPVVASGMLGSKQGWREAPYLSVPINIFELGEHLTELRTSKGTMIHIVPGLMRQGELVNVMRGEETQILGALTALSPAKRTRAWICLPGTHSKWARIGGTTVEDFETFMTGEVYEALCKHTILGRTMKPSARFMPEAFDRGVRIAESAGGFGVLSNIFSVRTFALTGQLSAEEQADYLSGLLIGHEINGLAALYAEARLPKRKLFPIILAGESSLCERYQRALELKGHRNTTIVADATTHGLWQIALRAGLVAGK